MVLIHKENELKKLSLIAKPDLIIISNVSYNHLENFKSEEDIALAKSEIFHGLIKNGQIILNYDNKWYSFLKKIALNYTDQITPFGIKKSIFSVFKEKLTITNFSPYFHILQHYGLKTEFAIFLKKSFVKYIKLDILKCPNPKKLPNIFLENFHFYY